MPDCCIIPQSLIDEALAQWACVAEQAHAAFGVECDLIYLNSSTSTTAEITNNIPELNSINARRHSQGVDYDFEDKTIEVTENSEKVVVRIYWDSAEWMTLFGYTSVPKGAVLFYAKLIDARRLSLAVRIRYTDLFNKSYTFVRHSEPVPCGFKQNKFCSSIWIQEE